MAKNINKGRRHELKMLKFKKRLDNYGLKFNPSKPRENSAFRSHGAPCNCWACRGLKYKDEPKKSDKQRIESMNYDAH